MFTLLNDTNKKYRYQESFGNTIKVNILFLNF